MPCLAPQIQSLFAHKKVLRHPAQLRTRPFAKTVSPTEGALTVAASPVRQSRDQVYPKIPSGSNRWLAPTRQNQRGSTGAARQSPRSTYCCASAVTHTAATSHNHLHALYGTVGKRAAQGPATIVRRLYNFLLALVCAVGQTMQSAPTYTHWGVHTQRLGAKARYPHHTHMPA